ncbi:hypothetical protein Bca52824_066542 [Brassica carinata]|uniref:Uncharacterized protein n=1 Tax=Brassica carinata TaxID=52824 RepID=A0A8X7QKW5_BRACI|nr:hypothetical protein Bca52824_066542 [Brassica carinata]
MKSSEHLSPNASPSRAKRIRRGRSTTSIRAHKLPAGTRAHYSGTSHPPETNALSQSQKRLDCSRDANSEHLSSQERQERPVSPQRSTQSDYQNTSRVPVPEEVIREAREELREVMIQYVNGADPSESAARRERMRYAEEYGETEQVIMNMAIEATVSAEGARRPRPS